jgi:hypothetical protein
MAEGADDECDWSIKLWVTIEGPQVESARTAAAFESLEGQFEDACVVRGGNRFEPSWTYEGKAEAVGLSDQLERLLPALERSRSEMSSVFEGEGAGIWIQVETWMRFEMALDSNAPSGQSIALVPMPDTRLRPHLMARLAAIGACLDFQDQPEAGPLWQHGGLCDDLSG